MAVHWTEIVDRSMGTRDLMPEYKCEMADSWSSWYVHTKKSTLGCFLDGEQQDLNYFNEIVTQKDMTR